MLAWDGGTVGIATHIDSSIPLGSPPPSKKPVPSIAKVTTELPESTVEGLFKKKLTKEEKKKINDEKKKARKAAKEAKASGAAEAEAAVSEGAE